ncbi:Pentatricopeptide repeat-containing protein, partial [Durusdinium trenchii]
LGASGTLHEGSLGDLGCGCSPVQGLSAVPERSSQVGGRHGGCMQGSHRCAILHGEAHRVAGGAHLGACERCARSGQFHGRRG